jgi:hypothetical protein
MPTEVKATRLSAKPIATPWLLELKKRIVNRAGNDAISTLCIMGTLID